MQLEVIETARQADEGGAKSSLLVGAAAHVATRQGEIRAGDLRPGMRVLTRDAGVQTIRAVTPVAAGRQAVRLSAGCLGEGLPEAGLVVAPSQRVLVFGEIAGALAAGDEGFVPAHRLTRTDGVDAERPGAPLVEIVLESDGAILADGAWIGAAA